MYLMLHDDAGWLGRHFSEMIQLTYCHYGVNLLITVVIHGAEIKKHFFETNDIRVL